MAKYQTYKLTHAEKIQYESLCNDSDLKTIPRKVIKILFNRGIRTKEEILMTLFGKINNLHDVPMRDSKEFCERLKSALENKEHVVVMGDYDTDGCMSTCVMVEALRILGFKVDYYMNSRFKDGYGLKVSSVNEIIKRFPNIKIIVTVDNGIKSFEAVDYCNSKGIDVLITDHHNTADVIPNAYAVVDPKRKDCLYPFEGLCGAGVAWKLMQKLCSILYPTDVIKRIIIKDLIWLVGIATVGDQVPLVNENRIIVKETLKRFNDPSCINKIKFMKMLKDALEIEHFDSDTIGFYISPMINAMGRIEGNPLQIVDAIISNDDYSINTIILKMKSLNEVRREQTESQLKEALTLLEDDEPNSKAILVYSRNFTEGIIGIVAGRLVDKFHKPVIVLCPNEDGSFKGSCRSIEGISIEGVLNSLSNYLVNFGGHDMAAGLTIEESNIEIFKEKFLGLCGLFRDDLYEDIIKIDLVMKEEDINLSICELIKELGPYGNSFPKVRVMLKDYLIDMEKSVKNKAGSVYVGKEAKTLRLVGDKGLVSIGFKCAEKYKRIGEPKMISCAGQPNINEFNGKQYPQFVIENDYIVNVKRS